MAGNCPPPPTGAHWTAARKAVFTPEEQKSPLAKQIYDLRTHAWAGHSVDVLLRIYAQCINGQ